MNRIYIIKNNINDKVYIGKTQLTIEQRFKEHKHDYLKREEEKRPLYDAMKKYGVENFYIELIEDNISDEDINEKEIYYIEKYNSYIGFENSNGYNATLGGDGKKHKEYNIDDIIKDYQQCKNTVEVGKKYGLDSTYILRLLKSNNINTLNSGEWSKINLSKKVYQLDKDTKIVLNIFNSIMDAKKFLLLNKTNGHLKDVLNNKCKTHIAYNYLWYFEEDYKNLFENNKNL